MANAAHRHLPRIKDSSGVNRYRPHIWNGFAWVEHQPYIFCETTNMWLYNNGNENTELTGGWISEGWYYMTSHAGSKKALGLTKNATNMVITNNTSSVTTGDSGIVHIARDVDLTPYSVLSMKCDFSIKNAGVILGAMPKGSSYFVSHAGAVTSFGNPSSGTGATITVDVSQLTGAYDIVIGMCAWASNNSVTVYEIELT